MTVALLIAFALLGLAACVLLLLALGNVRQKRDFPYYNLPSNREVK